MPQIDDFCPVPRKGKPIFFLVEITAGAAQNSRTIRFLRNMYDRLCSVFGKSTQMELLVGLYTFGVNCGPEPIFAADRGGLDTGAIFGDSQRTFKDLLTQLNKDLMSTGKLRFEAGCCLPTVYLISDCNADCMKPEDLKAVEKNRWFLGAKRWVISHGAPGHSVLAETFSDEQIKQLSFDRDMDDYIGDLIHNARLDGIVPEDLVISRDCDGAFMDTPFEGASLVKMDDFGRLPLLGDMAWDEIEYGREIHTMGVLVSPWEDTPVEDPVFSPKSEVEDEMGW